VLPNSVRIKLVFGLILPGSAPDYIDLHAATGLSDKHIARATTIFMIRAEAQRHGELVLPLELYIGSCSYCRTECRNCCGLKVLSCAPPSLACRFSRFPAEKLGAARAVAKMSPKNPLGSKALWG
jgi:hypothetical protein